MGNAFRLVHRQFSDHDSFTFSGIIDAGADTLFAELPGKVTTKLVKCNFSEVGRINSMGIALLLRCFKKIRDERGAEVHVCALTPVNIMLFKMTGVLLLATLDRDNPA